LPRPAAVSGAAETSTSAQVVPAGMALHTAQKGESLGSLVHAYLPKTSYLTGSELEAAIRRANRGRKGNALKPGEYILVPGYEAAPIAERPIPVERDFEVRAIYLTGTMAGSARGLEMIRRWNVPFQHALAPLHTPPIRNLPKFVRFLHGLGMHSIARIAIFRDESLVKHHPELAVRSRHGGQPWRENGKLVWTDPSHPQVQQYNIALARLAAESGVDEVQFDYVRFPAEGDQKDTVFTFQSTHPKWQRSDVIADFLRSAYAELRPLRVLFSLDVFGVMAWQRSVDLVHTGQDIVIMAKHCDVLSPMIYPSHFFGMDGYREPGDAPEHFIGASMDKFREITKGSGVVLRPWLQAFAWRTKTYSAEYILKQVAASKDKGGIGFLFWNARNDYSKPFAAMPEMTGHPARYLRIQAAKDASPAKVEPVAARETTGSKAANQ